MSLTINKCICKYAYTVCKRHMQRLCLINFEEVKINFFYQGIYCLKDEGLPKHAYFSIIGSSERWVNGVINQCIGLLLAFLVFNILSFNSVPCEWRLSSYEVRKENYKCRIKKANQNQTFQLYLTVSRSGHVHDEFWKVLHINNSQ